MQCPSVEKLGGTHDEEMALPTYVRNVDNRWSVQLKQLDTGYLLC